MTGAEARHLLDVIGAQWSRPIPVAAQPLWINYLLRHDVAEITSALNYLAERSRYAPAMSELAEVVRIQEATRVAELPPCARCGGDHLVPVGDAYAPCPDCHPSAASATVPSVSDDVRERRA